ncbi:MAG TPA: S-layer homology domain-containing protein, partial [Clostridia bacterium]|nr:S-layer homology domain-containing protein [Clostridia bacterium]
SATVAGEFNTTAEVVTPIGVTVFIKLSLSGEINGTMVVEQYNEKKFYLNDNGEIDFSRAGTGNPDRDFTIYGKLSVKPSIGLTVGAKITGAEFSITGRAVFDMNFTTSGSGSGKVVLTANMALKVLVFDFKWDIGQKEYDLFDNNRMRRFKANDLFANTSYLYEKTEDYEISSREYLDNRGEWQGGNARRRMRLMAAGENVFNEQTLLEGVYPYPYTLLAPIGENQQLLVFLDDDTDQDDRNRTQLYYSIYNGSSWSIPEKVDNDGTPDDNPWISDMGDKVLVAWSSAVNPVDETDTVMEVLNNRDIKASFFDKGTREFGEVQNVTFETETDTWSDGDPYIAYWKDRNGKENLMITYTKTQYEATGGDEQDAVVGDIINAYSVLAYSFYDFDNNRFHGQGFIDVSEYADVDESDILISDNPDPDDYSGDWRWSGYWSRVPEPDEVSMVSLGTDPLIVDSNAIGYEDYAILAYSIDMDKDIATTGDRELFIQLYSFPEGRFYPAIHFDDTKGQSDLEFVESNDNIYLYFISDGDIVNIDIGYLFSQNFLRYDIEGEDGHALVLNKLKGIYKKPEVAVRHKYDVRIDDSGKEYRINEYPIDQFMVKSDDNNVYVMWTESNITYRDGIDQNSSEATLPENQYREKQICAARQILGDITETKLYDEEGNPMTYPANDDEGNPIDYDITPDVNGETGIVEAGDQIVVKSREAEWSEPVKVTWEKGANFNDIDFEILPDGNLRTVFVKGMSEIMDVAGTDMSVENINNRILMTADYNANAIKAEVSIEPMKMPAQNEILPVNIALKNKTLNPLKDVTLELYQVAEGGEEKIDERTAVELRGGEEQNIYFNWQAPENLEDTKLQVRVKHNEEVLCSAEQDILAESIIDIIDASAAPSGRNRLKITGTAVNNGNITAADAAVYAGASGAVTGSTAIGSLKPEEEKNFEFFAELEPDMYGGITGEDGSVTETISLNVYSNGAAAKVINKRFAYKDDIDIVNNIEAFELKTGNNRISHSISLRKGVSLDIEPEITYNDEALPYARTVFVSNNEDIVDFSEGYMTLSGKKPGTATITAYALPPRGRLLLTPDRYEWVDNFATLADDAVKVRSFEVNVYSDAPSESDDKPGGGSSSTAGVQSPVTGAVAADNGMAVTTAKAYADKSGKASAVITSAQISSAVGKAVAAAKQDENTVPGIEIKVEAPRDAKTIETSIPASAIKEISNSSIELMTISTPLAEITLDDRTIAGIADKALEDIKITASEVDASALPAEAQRLIGDRPVYDFGITSGGNTISEFAGNVTVSLPYTPKADEDTNAIVIYYINAEGVPEVVSNCVYNEKTGTVSFKTDHFSKFAVGYNKITFRDVASSTWYSDAVSFAAARGITSGTGNGNFSPEAKLTRAQFLVMTMRAYGIRPDEKLKGNFDDAGSTYYTGYLSAAKALGIAKGTGNNLYEPDRVITRQEMFTLLYSTLKVTGQLPEGKAGKALTDFSDAGRITPWAKDAIALFTETGIISGSNGRLSPEDTGSRAQMAQLIYNLLSR